jgi:hypothetical protein
MKRDKHFEALIELHGVAARVECECFGAGISIGEFFEVPACCGDGVGGGVEGDVGPCYWGVLVVWFGWRLERIVANGEEIVWRILLWDLCDHTHQDSCTSRYHSHQSLSGRHKLTVDQCRCERSDRLFCLRNGDSGFVMG